MDRNYLEDRQLNEIYIKLLDVVDKVEMAKSPYRTARDRQLAILKTDVEKVIAWVLYMDETGVE